MPANRKYTDAQRQAMFRLYENGKTPAEIARLCKEGRAGVAPFEIPRRSCHDLVKRMARRAEMKLPTSIAEVEAAKDVFRFPTRIARMLEREIARLERKQRKHKALEEGDLEFLTRATRLTRDLERRFAEGPKPVKVASASKRPPGASDALLAIAERQRSEHGGGADLSPTRPQDEPVPGPFPSPAEPDRSADSAASAPPPQSPEPQPQPEPQPGGAPVEARPKPRRPSAVPAPQRPQSAAPEPSTEPPASWPPRSPIPLAERRRRAQELRERAAASPQGTQP